MKNHLADTMYFTLCLNLNSPRAFGGAFYSLVYKNTHFTSQTNALFFKQFSQNEFAYLNAGLVVSVDTKHYATR